MPGYAVAIGAMDMGTHRAAHTIQPKLKRARGDRCGEAQHHRERFVCGRVSSYQRQVLLRQISPPGSALIHVLPRFMRVDLLWGGSSFLPFVRCLRSLPNLHTLEIGRVDDFNTTPLKNALKGIKLPQIKTLYISPASYPLLEHCREVEDVVCAVRDQNALPDGFLGSLASNRDSKVKRLAIPLVTWAKPSRKRFRTL